MERGFGELDVFRLLYAYMGWLVGWLVWRTAVMAAFLTIYADEFYGCIICISQLYFRLCAMTRDRVGFVVGSIVI